MEETLKRNMMTLCAIMVDAGMSEKSIGRSAIQNATFFDRLRAKKGFTVRIYDQMVQWMSDNFPDGAVWPNNIERPNPNPKKEASDGE